MHKDVIAAFLSVTNKTVYNYQKENRPIIIFLNKYFNESDINEFLQTNKISKLENINNFNKLIEHNRAMEIIKILEKSDINFLCASLAENIERRNGISGITKGLRLNQSSKLEFLRDLEKILLDSKSETENVSYAFQYVVEGFNQDVGFDFSHTDTNIIRSIISRYKVYNTLYDLDKISTKD